jgi:hypothetical protein
MFATKTSVLSRIFVLATCVLSPAATAASWTVSVDQQQGGLPAIVKHGVSALSSKFVFWGNNWIWADMPIDFKVIAPFDYVITGNNQILNFDLAGRGKKSSSQQLVWEFSLNARSTSPNVIGGGISFKFELAVFGSELGEPELLPDNRGWAWGRADGSRMEMRFDPPLAAVYFVRGRKSEVRTFFYKGEVPEGQRRYKATLKVTGDMRIGPTAAERYGLDDPAAWPTNILDEKTSPVDLSFLNAREKPAGKHGYLKVVKDKLVFEDGSPVRFWGTNITAYAIFDTTAENVKQQARRLSELGFNLVRIVHLDSRWVDPNIFGGKNSLDTQNLNSAMLERLDWWIKCLKDEGIYVWLDLHIGRELKAGDHIDDFEEINKGKLIGNLFGYSYVNPSIQRAMKRLQ